MKSQKRRLCGHSGCVSCRNLVCNEYNTHVKRKFVNMTFVVIMCWFVLSAFVLTFRFCFCCYSGGWRYFFFNYKPKTYCLALKPV